MTDKIKIDGKTFRGEDRKYSFKPVDALGGLHILYNVMPSLEPIFATFVDGKFTLASMAFMVLKEFKEDQVKDLALILVKDASIVIDDEVFDAGETGIGDYAQGDPAEIHTAIFWALDANFPKYIAPLLDGMKSNDSSQDTSDQENE
jgi:hypothetical protein